MDNEERQDKDERPPITINNILQRFNKTLEQKVGIKESQKEIKNLKEY